MLKTEKKASRNAGFTLIEMTIVILIVGVMLAILGSALLSYYVKSQIETTEYRMEAINESLSQYLSINKRYPCVAQLTAPPTDTNFGREVGPNCVTYAAGGTGNVANYRTGSVPTRTLNLPDEFMLDGWGNRFTYAVTQESATIDAAATPPTTMFTNNGGRIAVEDGTGADIVGGTSGVPGAHYVIVSHGASGVGARSINGNVPVACPAAGTTLDAANCDNANEFVTTLVTSDATGATFFDDYVYYQGQTVPELVIPSGAVMAFNLPDCPDEWSDFTNADGRFVIGMGTDIPATSYDYAPLTTTSTIATNIDTLGATGNKDDSTMMMPYVALKYCQKD